MCQGEMVLPVSRAVHGLKSEDLLLHLEGKHVLTVVLPVAGSLPQFAVVDVWSDHFLEAPLLVFTLWCRNIIRLRHKSDTYSIYTAFC